MGPQGDASALAGTAGARFDQADHKAQPIGDQQVTD